MVTDPIANLLTKIRNSNKVYEQCVEVAFSQMKWKIVNLLKKEGFLQDCEIVSPSVSNDKSTQGYKKIKITLKFSPQRKRVITGLRRLSKPGRRVYTTVKDLNRYRKEFGVTLLSTQRGILTDKEAFREKVGGEVLCSVW